jgi:hypothetical protein
MLLLGLLLKLMMMDGVNVKVEKFYTRANKNFKLRINETTKLFAFKILLAQLKKCTKLFVNVQNVL